jgi:ABC-2 type transport system ATP-binding protein
MPHLTHPPGPDVAAVDVRGLRKSFDGTPAVDGLDLHVAQGTFAGLVGPNGAGKTTTLSVLTGLLAPDAGEVRVLGLDNETQALEVRRVLGVLHDGVHLFDRLTGAQLVVHAGMLHGLPRALARERAGELLDLFELTGARSVLVTDYSAGMRKKVALAAALVHAPRMLVLDEPFEAVDPVSRATVRRVLEEYVHERAGTVLVSSHSMELVEQLCDHVTVVARGRVVAAGTVDEVRDGRALEDRFFELVGVRPGTRGPEWLRPS